MVNRPLAGTVFGAMRDSATGRRVPGGNVCAQGGELPVRPCADADSVGVYRITGLPAGRYGLWGYCRTGEVLMAGTWERVATVTSEQPLRVDFIVDASACDWRQRRQVTGVFTGHYTYFEAGTGMDFYPCEASSWFLPSDSIPPDRRRAWVPWSAALRRAYPWPVDPPEAEKRGRYFVRWRGTVAGPGQFGDLVPRPFELRVDSVLEVRPSRAG
ncbi:MAG: carboxypeptidase regulatory-like domain-containing protein, partial [Gemmatimonadetes bacterium]|nr:carboxypeptidase regulatory-like domain-containing protein [Gemmatimonadota bacterium]